MSHLFFQGRFATTSHRWLNEFILAELLFTSKLPLNVPVVKPIFIIGIGRSGSTILGKVLSMHKDVGFLNEPKAIWYTIDPREDVNGHFSKGEAIYRFNENDVTPDKVRVARNLFGFYLLVTGTKRAVDKNPETVFRIRYVKGLFPDAKFIFLVRNGWDTIHSISSWSNRYRQNIGREIHDWWGINQRKWRLMTEQLVPAEPLLQGYIEEIQSLTREIDMAAVEWILTMQEGLRGMQLWPDDVYLVRYEQLTRCPEDMLVDLCRFCVLAEDPVFLQYSKNVLVNKPAKNAIELPPAIEVAFLQTMNLLGYDVY